jgi:FkbM family methyltransferase
VHIVHTEASLGWGGQEIRILTESQGMLARGHRVEIWAAADSNILIEAARRGIPHRAVPIARKNLRGLLALRRALAEARPDLVNTHSSTDAWLVALASLTLRAAPPMVRTRHISAPIPDNWPTRWLYMHAARHVVTTGERLRQQLMRDNRYRAGRLTSVPTGIDAARFTAGDKRAARQALGLDVEACYLGIVATLRSWKGHLYLIDAFARLAPAQPALRLVIVGDGPMHSALAERIATLGIGNKVTLAGRQERIEQWLSAMDVFCLPSYANEGVPQALLQAMLIGLPIVTTDVGSITEAVTDGVTGVIVQEKSVDALAQGLAQLLADPARARQFGQAARAAALERFQLDAMVTAMERIFAEVLERHRKRRRGWRAHGQRLQRSLGRRWREWRLPRSYVRLGTRYGGWWIDRHVLSAQPLLIDCGLGLDISFPTAFLARFGGTVVGIDPNPESLAYCRARCPVGMEIWDNAFWRNAGETITFHMPRLREQLPLGADGISGSLVDSHAYVGDGRQIATTTTSLEEVLARHGRTECDVLKLDIEGAEYEVLSDLCERGLIARTRQLLVEFHHGATHHAAAETEAITRRIQHAGFELVHVEGRNRIFRRQARG